MKLQVKFQCFDIGLMLTPSDYNKLSKWLDSDDVITVSFNLKTMSAEVVPREKRRKPT